MQRPLGHYSDLKSFDGVVGASVLRELVGPKPENVRVQGINRTINFMPQHSQNIAQQNGTVALVPNEKDLAQLNPKPLTQSQAATRLMKSLSTEKSLSSIGLKSQNLSRQVKAWRLQSGRFGGKFSVANAVKIIKQVDPRVLHRLDPFMQLRGPLNIKNDKFQPKFARPLSQQISRQQFVALTDMPNIKPSPILKRVAQLRRQPSRARYLALVREIAPELGPVFKTAEAVMSVAKPLSGAASPQSPRRPAPTNTMSRRRPMMAPGPV